MCIFVCAALPRRGGMGKIDIHVGRDCKCLVLAHLLSLNIGQRSGNVIGQFDEGFCISLADRFGVFHFQWNEHYISGRALHERPPLRFIYIYQGSNRLPSDLNQSGQPNLRDASQSTTYRRFCAVFRWFLSLRSYIYADICVLAEAA